MNLVEETVTTETAEASAVLEGSSVSHCPECGQPLLVGALQRESGEMIRLRCFARKAGPQHFVAECIDLDIWAEDDTLNKAIQGLHDAMIGYLLVVLDGLKTDEATPAAVLRPSPLSHFVRYYFEYLKYGISELIFRHHRRSRRFYKAPYGVDGSRCHV
jgi:hypothetical protein